MLPDTYKGRCFCYEGIFPQLVKRLPQPCFSVLKQMHKSIYSEMWTHTLVSSLSFLGHFVHGRVLLLHLALRLWLFCFMLQIQYQCRDFVIDPPQISTQRVLPQVLQIRRCLLLVTKRFGRLSCALTHTYHLWVCKSILIFANRAPCCLVVGLLQPFQCTALRPQCSITTCV